MNQRTQERHEKDLDLDAIPQDMREISNINIQEGNTNQIIS